MDNGFRRYDDALKTPFIFTENRALNRHYGFILIDFIQANGNR
jgi:hypothetical protein